MATVSVFFERRCVFLVDTFALDRFVLDRYLYFFYILLYSVFDFTVHIDSALNEHLNCSLKSPLRCIDKSPNVIELYFFIKNLKTNLIVYVDRLE